MKCLLKNLGQVQCAKVSRCLSWNQGFWHTYLGSNCAPVLTPCSPDKAVCPIPVKSPSNKGKRWHSTAD